MSVSLLHDFCCVGLQNRLYAEKISESLQTWANKYCATLGLDRSLQEPFGLRS